MAKKDEVNGEESGKKLVEILSKSSLILTRLPDYLPPSWKVANNISKNLLTLMNIAKEDEIVDRDISNRKIILSRLKSEFLSKF